MEYAEQLSCGGDTTVELKIDPRKLKNLAYTLVVEKVIDSTPTGTIEVSRSLLGCENFVTVFEEDGTTPKVVTLGSSRIYEVSIDPVVDAGAIERIRLKLNVVNGLINVRLIAT